MHAALQSILEFWISLDVRIQIAFIGAGATLLAATTAALVVAWQVRAQSKNAIAQSEKNEATKLKLQIYERILSICAEASATQLDYSHFVRMFPMTLRQIRFYNENNFAWTPPEERYATFSHLRSEVETKAIGVITAVENWGIVDPRMTVFQIAISAALHDVRRCSDQYFAFAMRLFPAPMPRDPLILFPWLVPSEADILELEKVTSAVLEAADTLGCYVHDFRVEMQRSLVGGIFPKGEIRGRAPLDPRFKVITLRDHRSLERFFNLETDWGRNAKRVSDDVIARVKASS